MSDSPATSSPPRWTPERQCAFLYYLDRTRSASCSAAAVGMSRESAYRCRARDKGGLFALMWNDIMDRPRIVRRVYRPSPLL
jgi:hypothetical protein